MVVNASKVKTVQRVLNADRKDTAFNVKELVTKSALGERASYCYNAPTGIAAGASRRKDAMLAKFVRHDVKQLVSVAVNLL